jgi:hypothetical protein
VERQILSDSGVALHSIFRIWAFLWVFFALLSFSVLILLSHDSSVAMRKHFVDAWVENATQISYPRFHFRIPQSSGLSFISKACNYSDGTTVNTDPCESWHGNVPPITNCFAVNADQFQAVQNPNVPREGQRLSCMIQTTVVPGANDMIGWELEGYYGVEAVGPNAHTVWIAPNNFTWVMLQKSTMKYHNQPQVIQEWDRTLLYHAPGSTPGYYYIDTIIGSFEVLHFEEQDIQNGWVTLGEIGGFIYFCLITHTLITILYGTCMDNTSKFLKPESLK